MVKFHSGFSRRRNKALLAGVGLWAIGGLGGILPDVDHVVCCVIRGMDCLTTRGCRLVHPYLPWAAGIIDSLTIALLAGLFCYFLQSALGAANESKIGD